MYIPKILDQAEDNMINCELEEHWAWLSGMVGFNCRICVCMFVMKNIIVLLGLSWDK